MHHLRNRDCVVDGTHYGNDIQHASPYQCERQTWIKPVSLQQEGCLGENCFACQQRRINGGNCLAHPTVMLLVGIDRREEWTRVDRYSYVSFRQRLASRTIASSK